MVAVDIKLKLNYNNKFLSCLLINLLKAGYIFVPLYYSRSKLMGTENRYFFFIYSTLFSKPLEYNLINFGGVVSTNREDLILYFSKIYYWRLPLIGLNLNTSLKPFDYYFVGEFLYKNKAIDLRIFWLEIFNKIIDSWQGDLKFRYTIKRLETSCIWLQC